MIHIYAHFQVYIYAVLVDLKNASLRLFLDVSLDGS